MPTLEVLFRGFSSIFSKNFDPTLDSSVSSHLVEVTISSQVNIVPNRLVLLGNVEVGLPINEAFILDE